MPANLSELENRLRAAYADAAATVQPDEIGALAPASASRMRWLAAARHTGRKSTALAAAAAVILIVAVATVVPHALQSGSRHRSTGPAAAGHLPRSHMAYVVTQRDLLVPVNLATGTALKPIPLDVAGMDGGVVTAPNGKTVYVVTVRGELVPVDVRTGKAGRPIRVGGVPQGLVITPDGKAAYVLEPPYGVVAVDLGTRTALGLIKIHGAQRFALTPDGKSLYVLATVGEGLTLTAIDTATNTTARTVTLRGPGIGSIYTPPPALCTTSPSTATNHSFSHVNTCKRHGWTVDQRTLTMAPDGKTVYVSYQSGKATARWNAAIIGVDVATNTEQTPIRVGVQGSVPQQFVISPDSQTGYLASAQLGPGSVIPVNLRTRTVLPAIALPASQMGYDLTLSPGGGTLYVTENIKSTVIPVNTATGTAMQPIQLGAPGWMAWDVVFAPGGRTLYVLSYQGDSKGALMAGRMTPVNAATGAVGKPIDFPAGLDDIVFSR